MGFDFHVTLGIKDNVSNSKRKTWIYSKNVNEKHFFFQRRFLQNKKDNFKNKAGNLVQENYLNGVIKIPNVYAFSNGNKGNGFRDDITVYFKNNPF